MSEPVGGKSGTKLHTKILTGLAIGAIAGVITNLTLGAAHPAIELVNDYVTVPLGQIFLRMLFMVVMPLVFASISLGVAGLGDLRRVGRVGGRAVGYFVVTTALAATLGLIVVNVMQPWERVEPETRTALMARFANDASSRVEAAATTARFGPETFVNIVPRNPIDAAAKTDMLGVIFFGLMFGAALTLIAPGRAKPMVDWLEALNEVVVRIIHFAMQLAPYGVAALIFAVASRFGMDLLVAVAAFVVTVLLALLLHVGVTLFAIIRLAIGISPLRFLGRVRSAIITAFSTSSSNATLPTNLEVSEQQLGIPRHIAGFVLPIGSTMCMNGTAIFEGTTVIFLAEIFGVDLTITQMAIVMVMSVITAIGAAGVPGGSIPLLVGILTMFGVPGEGIAIVIGVDRILDMSRTAVNVLSDLTATAWVARVEGVWAPSSVPETVPSAAS
jgi:DAACS family dicarboxylate/amino acid:cation (Na+ or H+) symporter